MWSLKHPGALKEISQVCEDLWTIKISARKVRLDRQDATHHLRRKQLLDSELIQCVNVLNISVSHNTTKRFLYLLDLCNTYLFI